MDFVFWNEVPGREGAALADSGFCGGPDKSCGRRAWAEQRGWGIAPGVLWGFWGMRSWEDSLVGKIGAEVGDAWGESGERGIMRAPGLRILA